MLWSGRALALLLVLPVASGCSLPPGSRAQDQGPDQRPDLAAPDLPPPDAPRARPDGASTEGAACTSDVDCSSGLQCDTTLPDGLCFRACSQDADCADAVHWGCLSGQCRQRCNVRSIVNPCRDKYVCRLEGQSAHCVADCRVSGCAESGWICDAASGLCLDTASGTVGAPCGPSTGSCEGTPNGVCLTVNPLSDGFCTLPCSPFTKPCPSDLQGAQCLLGPNGAPYCAFLCDPQAPSCPHPGLTCTALNGGYDVCLP